MKMTEFAILIAAASLTCQADDAFDRYRLAKLTASRDINVHDMVVDRDGNIYVAGSTKAADFPVRNAWQGQFRGSQIVVSTDRGATWKGLAPTPSARPSTFDVSPADGKLMLLTGPEGVYKTIDGGAHWKLVTSALYTGPALFDPADARRVYLAHSLQTVVSTDAGDTWQELGSAIRTIQVDPNGSGALLGYMEHGGHYLLSRDRGQSWIPLSESDYRRPVFAPGLDGWIYRSVYSAVPNSTQLFLSVNWGASWQVVSELEGDFGTISIDPDQPATLLLAGTVFDQLAIRRTLDGGLTFEPARNVSGLPLLLRHGCGGGGLLVASYPMQTSWDGGLTWNAGPIQSSYSPSTGPGCAVYALHELDTDAFLMKLDAQGQLVWSTFLGGLGDDSADRVRLDADGYVYVEGATASLDFPVTIAVSPERNNAFVAKFDSSGSIQYSTTLRHSYTIAGWAPTATGSLLIAAIDFIQDQTYGTQVRGTLTKLDGNGLVTAVLALPVLPNALTIIEGERPVVATYKGMLRAAVDLSTLEPWLDFKTPSNAVGDDVGNFYFTGIADPPVDADRVIGPATGAWLAKWSANRGAVEFLLNLHATPISRLSIGPAQAIYLQMLSSPVDSPLLHPQSQGATCYQPTTSLPARYWGQLVAMADASGQIQYTTYTNECMGGAVAGAPGGDVLLAPRLATTRVYRSEILRLPSKPKDGAQVEGVGNAVSGTREAIVPGALVEVVGASLGPVEHPIDLGLRPGTHWPFELAGTRVLFDGEAANLVSVSGERITALVPASVLKVPGGLSTVEVERDGMKSNALAVLVLAALPQVVPGSVRNADGSLNSASSPAEPDSPVSLLVNGIGVASVLYVHWNGKTEAAGVTDPAVASPDYAPFSTIGFKAPVDTARLQFAVRVPAPPNRLPFFAGGPPLEDWELSVPVTIFVK